MCEVLEGMLSTIVARLKSVEGITAAVIVFIEIAVGAFFLPGHYGAAIALYLVTAILAPLIFVAAIRLHKDGVSSCHLFDAGIQGVVTQIAVCVGVAFILEFCTLFGSYVASPLSLADWNVKRIAIYGFIVFSGLTVYGYMCDFLKNQLMKIKEGMRALNCKKIIVLVSAILVLSFTTSFLLHHYGYARRPVFAFTVCSLCCIVSVVFAINRKLSVPFFFSAIALSAGMSIILAFPASNLFSWDDEIHYSKALSLSYISDTEVTASDRALFTLMHVEPGFEHSASFNRVPVSTQTTWSENDIVQFETELNRNANNDTVQISEGISTDTATLVSVGYIPSAIGLWLGRLLHLPFVWTFALGRIVNLLFYVAAISAAIAIAPCKKVLIAVLGLIPTSLFLASNYSYDPWVISMTILGIAIFFRALASNEITMGYRRLCMSLIVLTLAFFAKAVYFPILGIALIGLLHLKPAGSSKFPKVLAFAFGLCMVLVASFVLPMIVAAPGPSGDMRGGPGVNSSGQLGFIFANPVNYMYILAHFLVTSYLPIANQENAMTNLAYLGSMNSLHSWLTGLMTLFIVVVAVLDSDSKDALALSRFDRLWTAFLVLASLSAVASALYISFTPVGLDTINGVQARYSLPLYFICFGLICSLRCKALAGNRCFVCLSCCIGALVLFITIWMLLVSRIVI